MLRWRKTSSGASSVVFNAQLSHPQRSRLMGMARKVRYFERLSTFLSFQNHLSAPIALFAFPILAATS